MSKHFLWGMIHVPALPGSVKNKLSMKEIISFCLSDAEILVTNGITNLFIENFWDAPFPKTNAHPHILSAISIIVDRIKVKFPNVNFGINVLRNDALSALGIATITNSSAIRVNVLTYARLTDQGIIEGCAYELNNYFSQLRSNVEIWADADVKHSVSLAPVKVEDAVKDLIERGGANKVIFTGSRTGEAVDWTILESLISKKIITPEQIVIGSGITADNIAQYKPFVRNFIVGSSLKANGKLDNPIDPNKVKLLVQALNN